MADMEYKNGALCLDKLDIDEIQQSTVEDPEGRSEVTTDYEGKIISFRDRNGIKHENVGIESEIIKAKSLNISIESSKKIVKDGEEFDRNIIIEDPLNIPHYGHLNFITEDIPFQYKDQVVVSVSIESVTEIDCTHVGYIQFGVGNSTVTWFDTKYYINKDQVGTTVYVNAPNNVYSPATALAVRFVPCLDGLHVNEDHVITYSNISIDWGCGDIGEIDSLIINIVKIDGEYKDSYTGYIYSINGKYGYISSLNKWLVWNWQVSKKPEHRGQIVIDIPGYMNTTEYATIKFQGNSTINDLKKSFRLTIYKDNTYNKKKKLKIGDMIELNGFNMKSFSNRSVRFNEPIAYRMVHMIWRSRNYIDQYPWNENHVIYTGSTGSIKQFPIKLDFNGDFYGVNFFGEKKDKTNYMLDGTDQSGMFLSLGSNRHDTFTNLNTFLSGWEDEMIDEDDPNTPWVNGTDRRTTQSNIDALTDWFNYFNGSGFNKETVEQHFSKIDWIDYMIFINVFCLQDNIANNVMLYSNENKTKFYPYIYDLDQALSGLVTSGDIFTSGYDGYDMSIYNKLISLWWEEIVERYKNLRSGCLSLTVFTKIVNSLMGSTNYSDFEKEINNWNITDDQSVSDIINRFKQRLDFCDSFYKI